LVLSDRISSYRDLRVWQESMGLAEACYRLTRAFPKEEAFGLSSQVKRSAASVPANIAEGHGLENTRAFIRHLRIAQGSLKELETHLLLAQRVGVVAIGAADGHMAKCEAIGKMLRLLIRSLQKKVAEP
jgi:four helix bundle protein